MGQLSAISVLAGTLAAYGAVAVLLAVAGGIAAAANSGTDFSNVAWTQLKAGTGIIVAAVLLVSYLFGGYVSGRMARRSGVINGFGVFVLGVIVALAVGVLVKQAGGGPSITTALRNVGAPTTWHEWRDVGTIAGMAALAAMLVGAMLGGAAGDRWHSKLLTRALDPAVGPEAAIARQAAVQASDADAAHLAAEQRVARSQGRSEPHLANGDRGRAAPGVAAAAARREPVAGERVAAKNPQVAADPRVAAAPAGSEAGPELAASERVAADNSAATRPVAADNSATDQQPAADPRPAATQRVAAGSQAPSGRAVTTERSRRSFIDRLRHR